MALDEENILSLSEALAEAAITARGWRRVSGIRPEPDDIVVMVGADGRHGGFVVFADGELGVLHVPGKLTPKGPVVSVVFDAWLDMATLGYHSFEFWRRTS